MYNENERNGMFENNEPVKAEPEYNNIYNEEMASEPAAAEAPAEPVREEPVKTEPVRPASPWATPGQTYYEPWREPVYREPEEHGRAYTPGLHTAAGYRSSGQYQPPKQEKPEKPKKSRWFLKAVCLVLVCALVSSVLSYAIVDHMVSKIDLSGKTVVIGGNSNVSNNGSGSASDPATTPLVSTGDKMAPTALYNMACEQVVGLKTAVTQTNIFGQTTTGAVSGSGFIISSDGYIVTNYHVIEYAVVYGYELTVLMHDGTSYPATVVGYEDDNDVAVVKIEATGLNAVAMGSSEDMVVGETVYAVGNPLGELEYTMTSGIVSALDRVITTSDQSTGTTTSINMFQIDAAVNSGNSGGPVYNDKGEVIGIVSAKYSSTGVEGLGFAIPIDDALVIVSDLIENGYVTGKPYFGITVSSITSSYAQYYGLVEGALVESVDETSCAAAAGLEPGDIITKLGEYEVNSRDALLTAKKNFKAGDTTTIVAYRNGEHLEFVITFDEEPANVQQAQQNQQSQQNQQGGWGGWGNFGTNPYFG